MSSIFQKIEMSDAEVLLYKGLFNQEQSKTFFRLLYQEIEWREEPVKIMGKTLIAPRLCAYYGDKPYRYSGYIREPLAWIPTLLEIKSIIEPIVAEEFNAVLINLYRNGKDYMGWHSDDERDIVVNSAIASVSFGETRRFLFRRKKDRQCKVEIILADGDVLIMKGETQKYWQHQIPKITSKKANEFNPRINLTFRVMI